MDREKRVAMVADYLIGLSMKELVFKYKTTTHCIYYWVCRHKDHFKLRDKYDGRPSRRERKDG